jgi:hypothetical protein
METTVLYQIKRLLQDDSTVLNSIDINNPRVLSQILSYVYGGELINIFESLYQRELLNFDNIYSFDYHNLVLNNSNTFFSLKIAAKLVEYFGHSATNKALTDMEIYRNDGSDKLLEVVGGFIPDLAYTINKLGTNLHDKVFVYLEENDQKYRAELLSLIQQVSSVVYSKLYPNTNYLVDVILAVNNDSLVSSVEFTDNFLDFLLRSHIDIEHGRKVMLWIKLNRDHDFYKRYLELYPNFTN